MTAQRRTILLTGASGVVGQALLPSLAHHRVVCLTHTSAVPGAVETVHGDLTAPHLGLDPHTAARLAGEIDTVVHCAAVTDFAARAHDTHGLNVDGTRRVLEFADRARALMHHVSSAFVARQGNVRDAAGEGRSDPRVYLDSKRDAEDVVRAAGLPGTVVRPSVVIGDSVTGAIPRFQGIHSLMRAVLRNALPLLPLRPDARIDFVPQDTLAQAVSVLVDAGATEGEYWVTAGDAALTTTEMIGQVLEVAAASGVETPPPRLVEPDMVDRLIRPVFIDPMPPTVRRRFDDMLALTALFSGTRPFPSTLGEIPGCEPLPHEVLLQSFRRSAEYLVRTQRLGRFGPVTEDAA